MLLPNNRSLFAYLGPLHKDQINDDENSDYDENSDENKNGDTNENSDTDENSDENSDTDENSDEDKSSVHSSPFLPPKHTCDPNLISTYVWAGYISCREWRLSRKWKF